MRIVRIGFVCALLFGTPAYATTLNLNDFVLFAEIGPVSIGNNTDIQSGAVGTNGNIGTGSGVTVNDLDAGGNIHTGNNTTVRTGSNVIAGGNYTNGSGNTLTGVNVTVGGTATYSSGTPASTTAGVSPAPFSAGSAYQLPTLPPAGIASPSSGASGNVTTAPAGALAPAGDYGALTLGNNLTLNLTAGTYHFTGFSIGSGSHINFDLTGGAINVLVDGNITIGNNAVWTPTSGDASDIFWETYGDLSIGSGALIYGTLFASGVAVLGQDENLGNNGTYTGQYLATGGISIGSGVTFNLLVNDRFTSTGATPIPATLPLFATGLGMIGLLGWRRKRKARALNAA